MINQNSDDTITKRNWYERNGNPEFGLKKKIQSTLIFLAKIDIRPFIMELRTHSYRGQIILGSSAAISPQRNPSL